MFQSKRNVDKHVSTLFAKIKSEKERNIRGYQIARLYMEVKEYDLAKKYLAGFLREQDQFAPAYILLGQIQEAKGDKKEAIKAYKRCLEIDDQQKGVLLKVCELQLKTDIDPERARYWAERTEKHFPNHELVFKLKEKACSNHDGGGSSEDLEGLIAAELAKNPWDVRLRGRLLQLYLDTGRVNEAYTHAIEVESKGQYFDSLEWYRSMLQVFQSYRDESGSNINGSFHTHYLMCQTHLIGLSLEEASVGSCVEALLEMDNTLGKLSSKQWGPEWKTFVTEMEAQYFYHLGSLVLKRALKGPVPWAEACEMAASFYLMSYATDVLDLESAWCVKATAQAKKIYQRLNLLANHRASQSGHMLKYLQKGSFDNMRETWQAHFSSRDGREGLYRSVFGLRNIEQATRSSFLIGYGKQESLTLCQPRKQQLQEYDKVAYRLFPNQLDKLAWLGVQYHETLEKPQPNYEFNVFSDIQFSTNSLNHAVTETFSYMDAQVFLFAATATAAKNHKTGSQQLLSRQPNRPEMLPACLTEQLCTTEQSSWWKTAYSILTKEKSINISKQRLVLQHGLEVVRLRGNHGIDAVLVTHVAQCLENMMASYRDGTEERGYCEMWTVHYYDTAVKMLERLASNRTIPTPRHRMFDWQDSSISPAEIKRHLEKGQYFLSTHAMDQGNYEKALDLLSGLKDPNASYRQAQIYKKMAENEGAGQSEVGMTSPPSVRNTLKLKAHESLLLTLDRIKGDRTHPLNKVLADELAELEDGTSTALHDLSRASSEEFVDAEDKVNDSPSKNVTSTVPLIHSTPARGLATSLFGENAPSTRLPPSPERLHAEIRRLGISVQQLVEQNEQILKQHEDQQKAMTSMKQEFEKVKAELEDLRKRNETTAGQLPPTRPRDPRQRATPLMPFHSQYPSFEHDILPALSPMQGYPIYHPSPFMYPQGMPHDPLAARQPDLGSAVYGLGEDFPDDLEDLENVGQPQQGQVPSALPDAHLTPEWPYGNNVTLEGKSTLTYAPPQRQPGYMFDSVRPQLGQPQQMFTPGSQQIMPGPGYFSPRRPAGQVAGRFHSPANMQGVPLTMAQAQPVGPAARVAGGMPHEVQPSPKGPHQGASIGAGTPGLAAASKVNTSFPMNLPENKQSPAPDMYNVAPQIVPEMVELATPDSSSVQVDKPAQVLTPTEAEAKNGESIQFENKANLLFEKPELLNRGQGQMRVLFNSQNQTGRLVMWDTKTAQVLLQHNITTTMVVNQRITDRKSLDWRTPVGTDGTGQAVICIFQDLQNAEEFLKQIQKIQTQMKVKEASASAPFSVGGFSMPASESLKNMAQQAQQNAGSKDSQPKALFGGFSFSSKPVVAPAAPETKPEPAKPAKKPQEAEKPKASPFAGFSFTSPGVGASSDQTTKTGGIFGLGQGSGGSGLTFGSVAKQGTPVQPSPKAETKTGFSGAKLFGEAERKDATEAGDDEADAGKGPDDSFEPTADFKPLVSLPEVDTPTGEENETQLFCNRAKLYRYDNSSKAYKERGLGELKILKEDKSGKYRIVMRREQVLKVCANHYITPTMQLLPLKSSANAWVWTAQDFSDGQSNVEQLAVKFKTEEIAGEFEKTFKQCVEETSKKPTPLESVPPVPKVETVGPRASLAAAFKPAAGSWECSSCYITNKPGTVKCVACSAAQPGSEAAKPKPAQTAPKQVSATSTTKGVSLADKFKPKEGSWECAVCYIQNKPDTKSCLACQTPKPGCEAEVAEETKASQPTSGPIFEFATGSTGGNQPAFSFGQGGGFQFGGSSGFKFGTSSVTSATAPATSAPASSAGGGLSFSTPASSASNITFGSAGGFSFQSSTPVDLSTPKKEPETVAKDGTTTPPRESQTGFSFGSDSTFTFKGVTPTKDGKSSVMSPKSPLSPEGDYYRNEEGEDSHIMFEPIIPLPDKIEVKTGEEDENELFSSRAKLFRYVTGEWKERGIGNIKILRNKASQKVRLLMRRDQVLKICLNHYLTSDMMLRPAAGSNGKGWVWYADDFSEGDTQHEQFAVRFKTPEIAEDFRKAFDTHKGGIIPETSEPEILNEEKKEEKPFGAQGFTFKLPSDLQKSSTGGAAGFSFKPSSGTARSPLLSQLLDGQEVDEDDDNVTIIDEVLPSGELVKKAQDLQLPESFYNYLTAKPCPGCIGCNSEDFDFGDIGKAKKMTGADMKVSSSQPDKPAATGSGTDAVFGGVNFSGMSFSSLASGGSATPFGQSTGFGGSPGWSGAGSKLFRGVKDTEGDDDDGDEDEAPTNDDIHFEPIVDLPPLQDTKTGEEGMEKLFSQRAKLYRWTDGTWKERGIGEIKVLRDPQSGKGRLLMRREQVLKLCCNHYITPQMKMDPLSTSETSWIWHAQDYSESEPKHERFAIKFKTVELATQFKEKFEECKNPVAPSAPTDSMTAKIESLIVSQVTSSSGNQGNFTFSTQTSKGAAGLQKESLIIPKLATVTGDKGNPYYAAELQAAAEDYDDEEDQEEDVEDDDDDDDEYEDEATILYSKRTTMFYGQEGKWHNKGMGELSVLYEEDLAAFRVKMMLDNQDVICSHIVCSEYNILKDEKKKFCQWSAQDFSTDDPVRRQFKVQFSSVMAASEFAEKFMEGVALAKQSQIYEKKDDFS